MGLAVADGSSGVVTPLEVVECAGAQAAARTVLSFAEKHRADRIVVGYPCRADGSPTPACRRSEALVRELARLGVDAVLQPEYLSTNEARRRARQAGLPSHRPVDHLAAQVLLEEHLGDR
jgi:RNase H-fold protein (predicted Holliday junction resolvase)